MFSCWYWPHVYALLLCCLNGALTNTLDINNVGSMAQALFSKGKATYSEADTAKQQAVQVSTISILNCAGRIIIGLPLRLGPSCFLNFRSRAAVRCDQKPFPAASIVLSGFGRVYDARLADHGARR